MKKRIYTGIAIVLTLVLMLVLKIYVSDYFFDAFFGVVACFASFEVSRILSKMGRYNYQWVSTLFPSVLLAINLIGIHYAGISADLYWILWTILIDIAAMVATGGLVFLYGILTKKSTLNEMKVRGIRNMSIARFSLKKTLNTSIAFVYPAFLFMMFLFINHIEELPLSVFESINSNVSVFMIVTALLVPMFTDTFAMLTGSVIGGKKLCPKLSPGKTISGAVGGVLWCVLLSACVYLIFGCIGSFEPLMEVFPIWAYLLIVFFGSIIAQCGDLFESMLKRRAKVSDSGKILPGHGGMLDRIDSYIYIAPYILLAFLIFAV